MNIVSYAQNFEDVMLWRALGHVERGFYIDVGTQHPVIDSVSKAFYEHGWRGIHIEPTVFYADLIRKDRPDELVIQAAIAKQRGPLRFFEIPDTGMSTASPEIAEHHRQQGYPVRETLVTAMTIDDVFAQVEAADIHWLKIDVEGFEREVLEGWRESARRPWVIVVESTYPNSQQETYQSWEPFLLAKGYKLTYTDKLNRYYLSDAHEELKEAFRFGPNFFDGFQLTESSWSARLIKQRYEDKIANIDRQKTEIENQIGALRETLTRAEADAAERERRLRDEAEQKLEAARAEAEAHVQQLVERERAFAEQLAQVQREAQQAAAEQTRVHAEREQALRAELAALRETLTRAEADAAERERSLIEDAQRNLDAARDLEATLRADLARQAERTAILEAKFAQVQQTLSWRLTAPLRRLGGWLAGCVRHSADEPIGVQTLVTDSPAADQPSNPALDLQAIETASDEQHSRPPAVAPVAPTSSDNHNIK